MSSIRDLEQPKGCIKVLACLKERQPACVSDIIRSTGLSQEGVYSSLERLEELDILRTSEEEPVRGRENPRSLTEWGDRLGNIVLALICTLREISGKHNIDPYLKMPVGSLSILVHTYHSGSITPKEAISMGLCITSASSAFRKLRGLGLVYYYKKKRFRRTTKVHKLTEDGKYLTRLLDIIDVALQWKGDD
ncbi:MAG: ArsR family transcriptional regulator [Methanomassiliicoccales archaeon]|nr:MAG: ArsR family transcriptional regulator [Methanomassiliicoccales archaeon]